MNKILAILLPLILISLVHAEDDKNYILRKKIQDTKKKIEEYSKRKQEIDENIKEYRTSHAKRIEKRQGNINKLEREVTELARELKVKKVEKGKHTRGVNNQELQFASMREKNKKHMMQYYSTIKTGFPYNIEGRTINIKKLINDCDFETISSEEIYSRYNNFLNKEMLLGLDSEVFVKDNIKYLRIGWLLLSYSDEEGKDAGILIRMKNKWDWNNKLTFTMRKAIRDSIKMVEGKKAPDVTLFPVPNSILFDSRGMAPYGGAK